MNRPYRSCDVGATKPLDFMFHMRAVPAYLRLAQELPQSSFTDVASLESGRTRLF